MFGSPSGGGEEMVSSSPSLPLVLGTPDSHLEDSLGFGGVQASGAEGGTEPPSPVDPQTRAEEPGENPSSANPGGWIKGESGRVGDSVSPAV